MSLCHCLCLSSWGSRAKVPVYCVKDKVVGTLEVNQCGFVEHSVLWWSRHLFFSSKAAKKIILARSWICFGFKVCVKMTSRCKPRQSDAGTDMKADAHTPSLSHTALCWDLAIHNMLVIRRIGIPFIRFFSRVGPKSGQSQQNICGNCTLLSLIKARTQLSLPV